MMNWRIIAILIQIASIYAFENHPRCGRSPSDSSQHTNGRKVTSIIHPWVVGIMKNQGTELHCSGSIISSKFIMSAAHCMRGVDISNLELVLGASNLKDPTNSEKGVIKRRIKGFQTHEKNKNGVDYDIAIIEVAEDIPFNKENPRIWPICLPEKSNNNSDHLAFRGIKVIGFGPQDDEDLMLTAIDLNVKPIAICNSKYDVRQDNRNYWEIFDSLPTKFNSGSVYCASNFGTDDGTCRGDSGGPALFFDGIKWQQLGVVHGSITSCDGSRFPSIFVRIENPDVFDWIDDVTSSGVVKDKRCGDGTNYYKQGAIDPILKKYYVNSMNAFTQDFLAVAGEYGNVENFVFSPFSMHSVLAMLISGVTFDSTTEEELAFGFGSAGSVIQNIEKLYGQFAKSYKGTAARKNLRFGSRLWTTPKYFPKIDEGYKCKIEELYDAEFTKFTPRDSEKEVNVWVEQVMQGKINKILDSVSPETAFLIVSTLFFKASWTESFNEGRPQEFTKTNGRKVKIPMMTRDSKRQVVAHFTTRLVRGRNDKCIALAIPYEVPDEKGAKGRFEIVIVMPENHLGLKFFQIKAEALIADRSSYENIIELALEALKSKRNDPVDYIVNMPEFRIDTNIEATELLRKLEIDAPFDDGEFDKIIKDEPFRVNNVKHPTTFEVTKDGTFGAAASSTELAAQSDPRSRSKTIDIDKPFLFFVRDIELDVIILAGVYADPDA